MMKKSMIATGQEIAQWDRMAIETIGIPSLVLMENAGAAVAREVLKSIRTRGGKTVLVVCGVGNNGGDGFVAARYLLAARIAVNVFIVGDVSRLKHDARLNLQILKNLDVPVDLVRTRGKAFLNALKSSDVVVDAIFGVGLNRALEPSDRRIISLINRQAKFVVAVDIPSGLDATSGAIRGGCVRAQRTVTFTLLKQGLTTSEGAGYAGRIIVVDIGIPLSLMKKKQGVSTS